MEGCRAWARARTGETQDTKFPCHCPRRHEGTLVSCSDTPTWMRGSHCTLYPISPGISALVDICRMQAWLPPEHWPVCTSRGHKQVRKPEHLLPLQLCSLCCSPRKDPEVPRANPNQQVPVVDGRPGAGSGQSRKCFVLRMVSL